MTRECSAAQAWELLRAQREPGKGTAAKVSRALRGPSEVPPAHLGRAGCASFCVASEAPEHAHMREETPTPALPLSAQEFERDNSKLHLQLTHERAAERRRAVAQLQVRIRYARQIV